MALMGGWWPTALSTAKPWPFCTTSTVIASGTTSSSIARQENTGSVRIGAPAPGAAARWLRQARP